MPSYAGFLRNYEDFLAFYSEVVGTDRVTAYRSEIEINELFAFIYAVKRQNIGNDVHSLGDPDVQRLFDLIRESPGAQSKSWIFQANPKRFDLLGALKPGGEIAWAINQNRDDVTVGDTVYYWMSGANAGIYGVGSITTPPTKDIDTFGEWGVQTKVEHVFVKNYVSKEQYVEHPVLAESRIIRQPHMTNFRLSTDEATAVEALMPDLVADKESLHEIVPSFFADSNAAGLIVSEEYARRFIASLLAKPFVILTGLSGSGKTKLAEAFAKWLSKSNDSYRIVAVGADWTSNENIVGYPNALLEKEYVKRPALDLLLSAVNNQSVPHFLILDEMNLSHVERYFADFLSAMESGEEIFLHNPWNNKEQKAQPGEVPSSVRIPKNLFIVGTVNVDETTYMFSPKVLDRANVIEFRADEQDIESYLAQPQNIDIEKLKHRGAPFGRVFVEEAGGEVSLSGSLQEKLSEVLMLFWRILSRFHSEFAFRTVKEITSFVYFDQLLSGQQKSLADSFDAQILQKILPKMQGSRKK